MLVVTRLSVQGSLRSGHQTAEMARTLKAAWDRLRNLTTCVCKCFEARAHLRMACCAAQRKFARVLLGAARAAVNMQSSCQGKHCWPLAIDSLLVVLVVVVVVSSISSMSAFWCGRQEGDLSCMLSCTCILFVCC